MSKLKPITEDTYIRQLRYSQLNYLSRLLDIDQKWERLVGIIPKRLPDLEESSSDYERRYTQLHIRMFAERGKKSDGSTTRSIIEDWGTQNTKVKDLLYILRLAQLKDAADYVSMEILHKGPVTVINDPREHSLDSYLSPPTIGDPPKKVVDEPDNYDHNFQKPGEKSVYDVNKLKKPLGEKESEELVMRNISYESGGNHSEVMAPAPTESSDEKPTKQIRPVKMDSESSDLISLQAQSQKIPYQLLCQVTDQFNDKSIVDGGRVIGLGGFGKVYLGVFHNGMKVAVKCLKNLDEVEKHFETELESLSKFRNENIVSLLGFSTDGPSKCLVYEYLCNGSLEDRLACKNGTDPLKVPVRVTIAQGTAEGIHFLNKNGIVHRDIKSANILLDENFAPKVGDFATVRAGPRGNQTTIVNTTLVIGTPAYLAPEAVMSFDISTKLDSYSFGVVILELLTGLPAMDQSRNEKDLKSFVDDQDDIEDVLDEKAGEWRKDIVNVFETVADQCLMFKKKQRKNVEDVIELLYSIKV